jgi:hypothetical protein
VIPQSTDTSGRTEYRLRIHKPMPVEISTTVGDVLHNLRSALDSLAHEIARPGYTYDGAGRAGVCLPHPRTHRRASIGSLTKPPRTNGPSSAARSTHPKSGPPPVCSAFRHARGGDPPWCKGHATYKELSRGSDLHRLAYLSNLDKHRRLAVAAWWPALYLLDEQRSFSARSA